MRRASHFSCKVRRIGRLPERARYQHHRPSGGRDCGIEDGATAITSPRGRPVGQINISSPHDHGRPAWRGRGAGTCDGSGKGQDLPDERSTGRGQLATCSPLRDLQRRETTGTATVATRPSPSNQDWQRLSGALPSTSAAASRARSAGVSGSPPEVQSRFPSIDIARPSPGPCS